MNKHYAEKWLNQLRDYWLKKDIDGVASLFKKTTFYQETPFMKPYTSFEEINKEWQHIKDENIQNIEINILAIDNNTLIAHWTLKQNDENFDFY